MTKKYTSLVDTMLCMDGEDVVRKDGKPITCSVTTNGYAVFGVGKSTTFLYHRVKFYLMNGYLPHSIDHIDRDKLNNHSMNLRAATAQENARNQSPTSKIKSGMKNVYFRKDTGKYSVRIKVNQQIQNFGTFTCVEEAKRVAATKRTILFGEFNGKTTAQLGTSISS